MISFTVGARRNEDVNAWDVHVEAWLDLAEEVSADPTVEGALAEAGAGAEGILIGRLDALMLHVWPVDTPEGLLEILELNDGDGNTWDAFEEVRSAANALTAWAGGGGAERLFAESEDPAETLILSRGLFSDPFVDRGVLLAMMAQHLTAFSPNRILFAHEEPPETSLPADQRRRVRERARAFLSVGDRVGFGPHVRVPEEGGRSPFPAPLGDLLSLTADRLLLVASVLPDGPDYPEWTIWDELELELIDVAEWARARLGVDLETLPEGGGAGPLQIMFRSGLTQASPGSRCSKAGISVSGSKS
jgi:hypothetical protein